MSEARFAASDHGSGGDRSREDGRGFGRSVEPGAVTPERQSGPPGSPARGACAKHGVVECKRPECQA